MESNRVQIELLKAPGEIIMMLHLDNNNDLLS